MDILTEKIRQSEASCILTGLFGDEFSINFHPVTDSEAWIAGLHLRRVNNLMRPSRFLTRQSVESFKEGALRHFTLPKFFVDEAISTLMPWGAQLQLENLYREASMKNIPMLSPFACEKIMNIALRSSLKIKQGKYYIKPILGEYLERRGLSLIAGRKTKSDLRFYFLSRYFSLGVERVQSKEVMDVFYGSGLVNADKVKTLDATLNEIDNKLDACDQLLKIWQVGAFLLRWDKI